MCLACDVTLCSTQVAMLCAVGPQLEPVSMHLPAGLLSPGEPDEATRLQLDLDAELAQLFIALGLPGLAQLGTGVLWAEAAEGNVAFQTGA